MAGNLESRRARALLSGLTPVPQISVFFFPAPDRARTPVSSGAREYLNQYMLFHTRQVYIVTCWHPHDVEFNENYCRKPAPVQSVT